MIRWLREGRGAAALALVVALYVVYAAAYFVPVMSGVDPNGYHVCARQAQLHGRFYQVPADEYAFVGRMWVINARGEAYPKYPPVYPAVAGLAMSLFGLSAGLYVNPVCAGLSILGMYALARTRLPRPVAVLCAFWLAVMPTFNYYAVRPMSHASSLCFLVWGYAAALRGIGLDRTRARAALCFAGGLLTGAAAGIRYTDALLALPPLIPALAAGPRRRIGAVAGWLAGLAVPYVLLGAFHAAAYGRPWTTGYALTGEQTGFAWTYFADNVRFYIPEFLSSGLGPVAALAACGGAICGWRRRSDAAFFPLWILPTFVLYLFYYWAPETRAESYLRFVLPVTIPCLLLAGVAVERLLERFPARPFARAAILAAAVLAPGAWGVLETIRGAEFSWSRIEEDRRQIAFVREHVAPGAVVFGPMGLMDSLDFFQDYRLYADELLNQSRILRMARDTLQPGPSGLQKQRAEDLARRLGKANGADYRRRILALIDGHLSAGRPVYWIGPGASLAQLQNAWSTVLDFEPVAKWSGDVPAYRLWPAGKSRDPAKRPDPTRRMMPLDISRVVAVRERPATAQDEMERLQRELNDVNFEMARQPEEVRLLVQKQQTLQTRLNELRKAADASAARPDRTR
jgi:hypothetical protein